MDDDAKGTTLAFVCPHCEYVSFVDAQQVVADLSFTCEICDCAVPVAAADIEAAPSAGRLVPSRRP